MSLALVFPLFASATCNYHTQLKIGPLLLPLPILLLLLKNLKCIYLSLSHYLYSVCPYCESYKSLEDCDKNLETQECQQWKTRCFVRKKKYGPTDYFMRGCMDPKTAKDTTLDCTQGRLKDVCQFGTCQEPGCLASFEN